MTQTNIPLTTSQISKIAPADGFYGFEFQED